MKKKVIKTKYEICKAESNYYKELCENITDSANSTYNHSHFVSKLNVIMSIVCCISTALSTFLIILLLTKI